METTIKSHKTTLDIDAVRSQFPILSRKIHGKPLIYLDNAASTQKPQRVIDRITKYYSEEYSNIHRGVHFLSQIGTDAYELTRKTVQQFINAGSNKEIIYTSGTTEGNNLIAHSYVRHFLKKGDEMLITGMEHHSNIVPWQLAAEHNEMNILVEPLLDDGTIDLASFLAKITDKVKFVSLPYVSNALGVINPIQEVIEKAHSVGAKVLVDAAQAIQHLPIDVQALDVDFLTFSGHKIYGPTGTGILFGKEEILNEMPPFLAGGDMIENVSFEKTTYNELPFKFEAGTPNIAGFVALHEAIEFVNELGLANIAQHEHEVLTYGTEVLKSIDGLKIYGDTPNKTSVISFLIGDLHPYDVGVLLDNLGIAIRTGHHCTQPIMDRFKIPGTCRASFAVYNTKEEIDQLKEGLLRAKRMLE